MTEPVTYYHADAPMSSERRMEREREIGRERESEGGEGEREEAVS